MSAWLMRTPLRSQLSVDVGDLFVVYGAEPALVLRHLLFVGGAEVPGTRRRAARRSSAPLSCPPPQSPSPS